ncbi:hypothetical protein H2248_004839 [Termitomyces sp. 'cryptogamus']|nr:hypothetical protein H2248_004839 [Termitomyces sp. 'cryptogamus']
MLRNDNITPYTNFASSSKAKPVLVNAVDGAGVCKRGVTGNCEDRSLTATTMPVPDKRVSRGLVNPGVLLDDIPVDAGGATVWETAGKIPPSVAGLGRRVRCQS